MSLWIFFQKPFPRYTSSFLAQRFTFKDSDEACVRENKFNFPRFLFSSINLFLSSSAVSSCLPVFYTFPNFNRVQQGTPNDFYTDVHGISLRYGCSFCQSYSSLYFHETSIVFRNDTSESTLERRPLSNQRTNTEQRYTVPSVHIDFLRRTQLPSFC